MLHEYPSPVVERHAHGPGLRTRSVAAWNGRVEALEALAHELRRHLVHAWLVPATERPFVRITHPPTTTNRVEIIRWAGGDLYVWEHPRGTHPVTDPVAAAGRIVARTRGERTSVVNP